MQVFVGTHQGLLDQVFGVGRAVGPISQEMQQRYLVPPYKFLEAGNRALLRLFCKLLITWRHGRGFG